MTLSIEERLFTATMKIAESNRRIKPESRQRESWAISSRPLAFYVPPMVEVIGFISSLGVTGMASLSDQDSTGYASLRSFLRRYRNGGYHGSNGFAVFNRSVRFEKYKDLLDDSKFSISQLFEISNPVIKVILTDPATEGLMMRMRASHAPNIPENYHYRLLI